MKVSNRTSIRKLALRSFRASQKRNRIAILAIALTAMLFTALFTVALSINASYQTYTFRQMGGYNHGSFKDVTEAQAEAIAGHPKVKQTGTRIAIGNITGGAFAKKSAEVSYMDENCTLWSYASPTTGRMPEKANEITMDTGALKLLGIRPELQQEITLTYTVDNQSGTTFEQTDTFVLVGCWEEDSIMPVHYINVSREYVERIGELAEAAGMKPFRIDLGVMMASGIGIYEQMEQVDKDLGYTWEDREAENAARIGVNWGYTTEQVSKNSDPGTLAGIVLLLLVILFTGYLIIYNIFQISVSGDIRYYGLLKTIGVTPGQLRRIIRFQAFFLSAIGIPLGLLTGFGIGAALSPYIAGSINDTMTRPKVSASPAIFIVSALFTLATVLISCARPGRLAGKVSPVEATKYIEQSGGHKKARKTRGAGTVQMALANLGGSPAKTGLVMVSLAFAVVLFDILYSFVGGFDMEKYLEKQICADFIVSSSDYFHYNQNVSEYFPEQTRMEIEQQTEQALAGSGWRIVDADLSHAWITEELWKKCASVYESEETIEPLLQNELRRDGLVGENTLIEGIDEALFEKLTVIEGDLSSLTEPNHIAVVLQTDDYGEPINSGVYPDVGEKLTITYTKDAYFIDSRTGERCDDTTPFEYLQYQIADGKDVEYTICAYVTVPISMGFRFSIGYDLLLPTERLRADSEQTVVPMFYLFDAPDPASEQAAEQYLANRTAADPALMYESKATLRKEFEGFQNMFLLVGGLLCVIIAVIGALNFFNAIMTGIFSRKREFAILQAVGMTNRQLKNMLILEGLFYALGALLLAAVLSLILNPFAGSVMETMFWFFSPRFTVTPVLLAVPVFLLLGWSIPTVLYGQTVKTSVVERIRELG